MIAAVACVALAGAWAGGYLMSILHAQGSAAAVPRTPWGEPDLQGIWSPGYYLTPLERPNKYEGREFLTDQEVVELEKAANAAQGRNARLEKGSTADVEGAYNDAFTGRGKSVIRTKRTSLIIEPKNGKIPPLTPEAQKRAAESRRQRALATPAELVTSFVDGDRTATPYPVDRTMGGGTDHPEQRPADRCSGISLPFMGTSGTYSRFVQTPGAITIYHEDGHRGGAYRNVPIDGRPHLPKDVQLWLGHSVGRWEGDTLVVETTNFKGGAQERGMANTVVGGSSEMVLVERFKRLDDGTLDYRFTVRDPAIFTAPWTASIPMSRLDGRVYEYACHEGNYAIMNMLKGARANEERAKASR
jgi:hypothetical protein